MSLPILVIKKISLQNNRMLPADNFLQRGQTVIEPRGPLQDSVMNIIERAGLKPKRKDAVVANDIVVSVSQSWFDRPEREEAFKAESVHFVKDIFSDRLAGCSLVQTGTKLRLYAVIVPIVRKMDGTGLRLTSNAMFTKDSLKTLQDLWQTRLISHGVGSRETHSSARKISLMKTWGLLETAGNQIRLLGIDEKRADETSKEFCLRENRFLQAEQRKRRDELLDLRVAAQASRLQEAETATRGNKVTQLIHVSGSESQGRHLQREKTDRVRALPVNQVAVKLGFLDEIGGKENAINLVRRVRGLTFKQATSWLSENFPENRGFQESERGKREIARKQLTAIDAALYRITCMISKADGDKTGTRNLTKINGEEQLATASEVLRRIPQLSRENGHGGNIFITPIEKGMHFVLVDDLTNETLRTLVARGYKPATIVETSPGSFQAVIKVPDAEGNKETVNEWFKDINRDLGDKKITGLRHPFRLAGFTNQKTKHQRADGTFPVIELHSATNRCCVKAQHVIEYYSEKLSTASNKQPGRRTQKGSVAKFRIGLKT